MTKSIRSLWFRAVDVFLFTSVFIALCSVVMTAHAQEIFGQTRHQNEFLVFVLFATLASYNFHWYLTPEVRTEIQRSAWSHDHKALHLSLSMLGTGFSIYFGFQFLEHGVALSIAVILTFLYSAPKIPHPWFQRLKKIAIGKTIYLSFVWVYVTTVLPLIISEKVPTAADIGFCLYRFFLIYAICILFDYRDRENDRKDGIRSLITVMRDKNIRLLFFISLFLSGIFAALSRPVLSNDVDILILCIPLPILAFLYKKTHRNFSDYLYYFVLDGLMALSSLLYFLL